MSEAAVEEAPAGIGDGVTPEGAKPEDAQDSTLINVVDEQFRDNKTLQSILDSKDTTKAIQALAKQVWNQEKLIGVEKIPALKEGASAEEVRDWRQQYMGVPKEADGYVIPEKLAVAKDEESGEETYVELGEDKQGFYRNLAAEAQLTPDQAEVIVAALEKNNFEIGAKTAEQIDKQVKEQLSSLYAELGPAYKATIDEANYGYTQLLPEEVRKLMPKELVNHPEFVKAMAAYGSQVQDDQTVGTEVNGKSLSSPEDAIREIRNLHNSEAWRRLMAKDPTLSPQEKERLTSLNERLYKIAYPSEEA